MEVGNSNSDIRPSSMLMNGWNPTKKFQVKEFFDKMTSWQTFSAKLTFQKTSKDFTLIPTLVCNSFQTLIADS